MLTWILLFAGFPIILGSLTIGIKCSDGIVLGADTISSSGVMVDGRQRHKVFQINSLVSICCANGKSDVHELYKELSRSCRQYEIESTKILGISSVSRLARNLIHDRFQTAHVLLAGFDETTQECSHQHGRYASHPAGCLIEIAPGGTLVEHKLAAACGPAAGSVRELLTHRTNKLYHEAIKRSRTASPVMKASPPPLSLTSNTDPLVGSLVETGVVSQAVDDSVSSIGNCMNSPPVTDQLSNGTDNSCSDYLSSTIASDNRNATSDGRSIDSMSGGHSTSNVAWLPSAVDGVDVTVSALQSALRGGEDEGVERGYGDEERVAVESSDSYGREKDMSEAAMRRRGGRGGRGGRGEREGRRMASPIAVWVFTRGSLRRVVVH